VVTREEKRVVLSDDATVAGVVKKRIGGQRLLLLEVMAIPRILEDMRESIANAG